MVSFCLFPHGEDAEFRAWCEEKPAGFVINCKPEAWTLHRSDCGHLTPFTGVEASLTKHDKLCSMEKAGLQEIARVAQKTLEPCGTCRA